MRRVDLGNLLAEDSYIRQDFQENNVIFSHPILAWQNKKIRAPHMRQETARGLKDYGKQPTLIVMQ